MERTDDRQLLARARRAYERDRATTNAPATSNVTDEAVRCSTTASASIGTTGQAAASAVVALVAAVWRGGGAARGARLGLVVGLPALVTPSVVAMVRGAQCSACLSHTPGLDACFVACLVVSSLAGVAVGALAARDAQPGRFVIGGVAAAALTGALACGLTGLGGGLGVAAGLAGSSVPALLVVRRMVRA